MLQPVAAYPPYAGPHPHQRLHLHHHHPPPQHHHHQPQQQQHPYLHHDVYAPQPQYHAPLLLTPAYRPLQMPLQQHSSPVVAPDQQQQQQQQLALAQQQAATPQFSPQASAPDPGLHLHHHHNNHNHPQHPAAAYSQQRRDRSQQSSMAYQPSDDEMAEMQRLSAAYESEATVRLFVDARVAARVCTLPPTSPVHAR